MKRGKFNELFTLASQPLFISFSKIHSFLVSIWQGYVTMDHGGIMPYTVLSCYILPSFKWFILYIKYRGKVWYSRNRKEPREDFFFCSFSPVFLYVWRFDNLSLFHLISICTHVLFLRKALSCKKGTWLFFSLFCIKRWQNVLFMFPLLRTLLRKHTFQ